MTKKETQESGEKSKLEHEAEAKPKFDMGPELELETLIELDDHISLFEPHANDFDGFELEFYY